jgi:hypothetical protein
MSEDNCYPNLARLECDIRSCFNGVDFDARCLRKALDSRGQNLKNAELQFRAGIDILMRDDIPNITVWLGNLDSQLS